jgi:hypothetical protein
MVASRSLRSETPVQRERTGLVPDTQGISNANHPTDLDVEQTEALGCAGSPWPAAAFDVAVVSCFTEAGERIASSRVVQGL